MYKFHGGCSGCSNELHVCPNCCYFFPDWKKPNLNSEYKNSKREIKKLRRQAIIENYKKIFEFKMNKLFEDFIELINNFE